VRSNALKEGGIDGRNVELVSYNDKGETAPRARWRTSGQRLGRGDSSTTAPRRPQARRVPVFTRPKLPQVRTHDCSPNYENDRSTQTPSRPNERSQIGAEGDLDSREPRSPRKLGLIHRATGSHSREVEARGSGGRAEFGPSPWSGRYLLADPRCGTPSCRQLQAKARTASRSGLERARPHLTTACAPSAGPPPSTRTSRSLRRL